MNKKYLLKGNKLFREKKYSEAELFYKKAIEECNIELKEVINFNFNLIKLRSGGADECKSNVIKPEWLEEYHFEKIKESGFFDIEFYARKYPEKLKGEINLLEHYLTIGIKEGLQASPFFDVNHYLNMNPDIREAGINPFIHYVCNGQHEGREAIPRPYKSAYEVSDVEYIPRVPQDTQPPQQLVKPICFYLPQYHPIPENDQWWGKGFTEWTNVKPAKPQFEGHYQPHVPHEDIGYYNLLDREAQSKQIELAKQYGIGGFCYYLYWFSGKRLLEQPLDKMLADPSLDFPFCVCWANENWSRRWDGLDHDLLMVQNYSDEDDIAFIKNISKYLKDKRYIRVEGKPLLLIYRPNLFPDMLATVKRWRDWCMKNDIGEIYIAYPQSFESVNPDVYGFDAALEFPPNNSNPPNITHEVTPLVENFQSNVYDWRVFLERSESYKDPEYTFFRSATPSWDNTARKKNKGTIFHNSCPKLFEKNLVNAFSETVASKEKEDERIVFINAWNEWAEGAHLEPDMRYGYAWLQAIKNAQEITAKAESLKTAIVIHAFYMDVFIEIMDELKWVNNKMFTFYISSPNNNRDEINRVMKDRGFKYKVYVCENRGRDVLPFINCLPQVIEDKNDLLIKVHTKKSLHREDGDKWRQELYSQLLSSSAFSKAKSMFVTDDKLSFVSPDNHIVPLDYYWGSNEENVKSLCFKAGYNFSNVDDYEFIAGTMFYANVNFFKKIIDMKLGVEDFEEEAGQLDGTLAHAIERFFGVLSKKLGMKMKELGIQPKKEFLYAKKIK
ncbi:rhamnan synthesis F family protein [Vreelandella alkaliphila]|uniref:glycoside hydrolase family 99-like domain-containing protein n=1 Tax=Vreelandella alkaliphila TaxID=272774 RepID=UPI000E9FFD5E|nr:glycoside hydrolase family 99-like domain-containing protein [Halomonas alkaliphila]AYF34586.1 rhamnan synthesis F family protein [Halomonas alkaliphila]